MRERLRPRPLAARRYRGGSRWAPSAGSFPRRLSAGCQPCRGEAVGLAGETVLSGERLARPDVGPVGCSKRLFARVGCQKADVQSRRVTAKIVPGV